MPSAGWHVATCIIGTTDSLRFHGPCHPYWPLSNDISLHQSNQLNSISHWHHVHSSCCISPRHAEHYNFSLRRKFPSFSWRAPAPSIFARRKWCESNPINDFRMEMQPVTLMTHQLHDASVDHQRLWTKWVHNLLVPRDISIHNTQKALFLYCCAINSHQYAHPLWHYFLCNTNYITSYDVLCRSHCYHKRVCALCKLSSLPLR